MLLEGEGREGGVEQGGGAWVEEEGDEVQVEVLVGETKVVQDRRDEVEVGCRENWVGVWVLVSVYTLVAVRVTSSELVSVVEIALPRRVIGITVVCSSISVNTLVDVWVTR